MPPVSVLAASPPPPPGAAGEPPAPPGAVPRLTLATPHDKPAGPKGLQIRVAESQPKIGGKPVARPGGMAPVLRRRPALGIVAKAGIAVLVLAVAVGGVFSYRIFFPAPVPVVPIKLPPIAKPVRPADVKQSDSGTQSGDAAASGKLTGGDAAATHRDPDQANADAAASGRETPTPTPTSDAIQSVMVQTNITSEVKVNNTPIDISPAASAEFRIFVGNASIGGVFQGTPARAIINGKIVRAGQLVDNPLGIMFDRIDAVKKVIYFKDTTGATVSKTY